MTWPYPGDSPVARTRRVAIAYRAALEQTAPLSCAALDKLIGGEFGQTWVLPGFAGYEPDEWLSPADAAALACVEVDTIRQMRRRGVIHGRQYQGRWQYRAKEIVDAFAQPRSRNRAVTDTLPTSGSSAPEGTR